MKLNSLKIDVTIPQIITFLTIVVPMAAFIYIQFSKIDDLEIIVKDNQETIDRMSKQIDAMVDIAGWTYQSVNRIDKWMVKNTKFEGVPSRQANLAPE